MHIKSRDYDLFESLGCSEICVLCPDVTANSGMPAAEIVKGVADKVIYMADGVIEEMGTPEEVFDNPKSERTKAFISKFDD